MALVTGEEIVFTHLEEYTSNRTLTNEEINEKYIKGEVRIVTEQARYPLSSITTMLDSGDYLLNPEFQRRHRWSNIQKSLLMESFIMNVPIPPIFLYEDQYGHYEVMDGLQRLTAINDFYKDKYQLTGLKEWPELNGKSYSSLPLQIKKGIDRRYLSSIILLQETAKTEYEAKKLKQLVFDRINSGGVKLAPQESRNAIFNGPFNLLCIKLSENKTFKSLWDIAEPDIEIFESDSEGDIVRNKLHQEMQDVELVLRFFANRQREKLIKRSNLIDFLDNYLRYANAFSETTMAEMSTIFTETINFVYELLGKGAFRLYRQRSGRWSWYKKSTTAVYDPLMLVATKYLPYKDKIMQKKNEVKRLLENFYKNNYDTFEGRNTNPGIVRQREECFEQFFSGLII